MNDVQSLIDTLQLQPHPEGGWYREEFRSSQVISLRRGRRAASTAIYFLLVEGTFSAWHRVRSDEVWHHYLGDRVDLHTLDGGAHRVHALGGGLAAGERPQVIVRADVLQAGVVEKGWALCGCTVAPGFDFADFSMPGRAALVADWPQHVDLITRYTRS